MQLFQTPLKVEYEECCSVDPSSRPTGDRKACGSEVLEKAAVQPSGESEVLNRGWPGLVLLMCAVQFFFAGNSLLGRVALEGGANPIVFSLYRDAGGAIVMLSSAWLTGCWQKPGSLKELWHLTLLGTIGVGGGQNLVLLALQFSLPTMVTLFQLLMPIMIPVVAAAVGLEQIYQGPMRTALRFGGLFLCIAGAVGSVLVRGPAEGEMVGILCLGVQVTCLSYFHVGVKQMLVLGWSPIALVAWGYTIGTLAISPLVVWTTSEAWQLKPTGIFFLLYSILFTTVFNYFAMALVNKHLGPTTMAVFSPLQTIFAALGQPLVGLASPTLADAVAVVVVVLGLVTFLVGEASAGGPQKLAADKEAAGNLFGEGSAGPPKSMASDLEVGEDGLLAHSEGPR
eukprot:TRINITY_DN19518_c0_g1_i1.p1 TRINITY_DN19518_c0_g1~~TRINITY_DN19518_c0_g1_i1.p1  ORF type:complete len:397 (-),score=57.34 TRINITY_DN19518_c0_g1_i1:363-1553(-)